MPHSRDPRSVGVELVTEKLSEQGRLAQRQAAEQLLREITERRKRALQADIADFVIEEAAVIADQLTTIGLPYDVTEPEPFWIVNCGRELITKSLVDRERTNLWNDCYKWGVVLTAGGQLKVFCDKDLDDEEKIIRPRIVRDMTADEIVPWQEITFDQPESEEDNESPPVDMEDIFNQPVLQLWQTHFEALISREIDGHEGIPDMAPPAWLKRLG